MHQTDKKKKRTRFSSNSNSNRFLSQAAVCIFGCSHIPGLLNQHRAWIVKNSQILMEVLNCSASALHPDLCPHLDTAGISVISLKREAGAGEYLQLPLTLMCYSQTVGSPRRASRGVALTSPPVAPRLSKTGGKAMTPVLCHGPLRTTARLSLHHPPDSPHSTPPPPPRQTLERKQ